MLNCVSVMHQLSFRQNRLDLFVFLVHLIIAPRRVPMRAIVATGVETITKEIFRYRRNTTIGMGIGVLSTNKVAYILNSDNIFFLSKNNLT